MFIPLFKPLKYPSLKASDNNYLNHEHRYNPITPSGSNTSKRNLVFMGLLMNRMSYVGTQLDAPTFNPPAGEIS